VATQRDALPGFEEAARRAVSLVCVSLPHLSGLAHMVRIAADERVGTAGVFASGRLLINPRWLVEFSDRQRAFVLAHELLHLALRTHGRAGGSDRNKFNAAHDLIINDMLETELGMLPPAGGLRRPGARHLSAEALMLDPILPMHGFPDTTLGAAMAEAMARRGHHPAPQPHGSPDDVLDVELEAEWFPDESPQARAAATEAIQREAAKALLLQRVQASAQSTAEQVLGNVSGTTSARGRDDRRSAYVDALHITYRPPWQLALHRWLDAVTTPQRTYTRASRRGADRTDIVLPGRIRDAQTISVVLDTSGSMTGEIAHALGSIMAFGQAANIETVRIVQCDTAVTADDVVAIDDLATYRVAGFGGSDMTPAMEHLARDPDTTAVVVITDGAIGYPDDPMPYHVLWVVYRPWATGFAPGYGQVIHTDVNAV
jgi:predicted metal-dependent peptidase